MSCDVTLDIIYLQSLTIHVKLKMSAVVFLCEITDLLWFCNSLLVRLQKRKNSDKVGLNV